MSMELGWQFDNSYARLPRRYFAEQNPTAVKQPELILFNKQLAESLGLNAEDLESAEGVAVFAGNQLPKGSFPLSQAYAGHQFGNFTMLGDGRAVLLGEQMTPTEERFDIQLKGAGRTPYSRGGDGRASLGPMLREYLISEAMHALGVPTTRGLAVVTTGEPIYRETKLPGAILTRVASSHLRVGTFEFAARWGKEGQLQTLADYAVQRHFPHIEHEANKNKYLSFFQHVVERQAKLIAKWQLVGFIHGVMNTDNMTISGETIDYGPCAFMDEYDLETVFSSIDQQGRYKYGNQPGIGQWNLARFAETLLPLFHEDQDKAIEMAKEMLSYYAKVYEQQMRKGMREKLGLFREEEQDESLIKDLLDLMEEHKADYTNTFKALTFETFAEIGIFATKEFQDWHRQWQARVSNQKESEAEVKQLMMKSNPAVIPRNHLVEEALEAAVEREDYSVIKRLHAILTNPYAHTPEQEVYSTLPEPSHYPYQTFCGT